MTTLIIARHGNTFGPKDTPTRVGARTDIPLVEKGRQQGTALGQYLKNHGLLPDAVYSSNLQRTKETATLALQACGIKTHIYALDIFNEIDYGVDENQTEEKVIARIGKEAIEKWDKQAIAPEGWHVDPDDIIQNWHRFAHQVSQTHDTITNNVMDISETILVVTSNGVARFAPYITGNFEEFASNQTIKLSTGAFGILKFYQGKWRITEWNTRPPLDECG
ncbi:MAG: phosphoglycerate mutase [Zetaproteobacteria bacterium]|nr:MAG: phosphoglycerate mutase [Zetaproteobacteria bacterium]